MALSRSHKMVTTVVVIIIVIIVIIVVIVTIWVFKTLKQICACILTEDGFCHLTPSKPSSIPSVLPLMDIP